MGCVRSRDGQYNCDESAGTTWPPPLRVYKLSTEQQPPPVPVRPNAFPDNYMPPCNCRTCQMAVAKAKESRSSSPSPPQMQPEPTPAPPPPPALSKLQDPFCQQPMLPQRQKKPEVCSDHPIPMATELRSNCSRANLEPMSSFHEECLNAHNQFRARHRNCPPLQLNKELCQYAEKWAKHLVAVKRLEHRPGHTYGENLFMSSGIEIDGFTPVKSWYDEIRYYDYSLPRFTPGTGHFTQVVWRDSKQLGVGRASKNGITFVVCNYNPYGNVAGQFEQNVTPSICPP